jgi:hypothetical protein
MLQQPGPQLLLKRRQRPVHGLLLPPRCRVLGRPAALLQLVHVRFDEFLAELGEHVDCVDAAAVAEGDIAVEEVGAGFVFAVCGCRGAGWFGEALDCYRDGARGLFCVFIVGRLFLLGLSFGCWLRFRLGLSLRSALRLR